MISLEGLTPQAREALMTWDRVAVLCTACDANLPWTLDELMGVAA